MREKGIGKIGIIGIIIAVAVVGAGAFFMLSGDPEIEITDVTLSKDMEENTYEPINETSTFNPKDLVYLTGKIHNPRAGTELYDEWYDSEDNLIKTFEDNPFKWDEADTKVHSFYSYYRPEGGWNPGEYSVEIVLDGEVVETVNFEVVE